MMGPSYSCFAITPNNTAPLAKVPQAIWVGGAGNLCVIPAANNSTASVIFSAVSAGSLIPVAARIVMSTGTSATLLVALA